MKRGRTIAGAIGACAAMLALVPASEAAQTHPAQHSGSVSVGVQGVSGNHIQVGDRVTITANLRPFQKGDQVKVLLLRDGKVVERNPITVHPASGGKVGRVSLRTPPLTEPGRYAARAIHSPNPTVGPARDSSGVFRISYPGLRSGQSGNVVATFNDLLNHNGYANAPNGGTFNAETGRAVHAFRKVNGMSRNEKVTADLYHLLATGKGAYDLKYPDAGKHVEVDLSRQVMTLADNGKPQYTYNISSGKPSTPSTPGAFHFQWKDPGYNSLGMYYSSYYNGGEAVHGYVSVPDYAASHGCIREPIPDAIFIYNWIDIGDPIWVYN